MLSSRIGGLILASLVALGAAGSAHAVNLVYNGDFELIDQPRSRQISYFGPNGDEQYLPGWTNGIYTDPNTGERNAGYNFYVTPGTATTVPYDPATSVQTNDFGYLSIWSAANGGAASNTFDGYSPAGGNFVMADGDFRVAPISQQINDLTVGTRYNLSFVWAGGQQYLSDGATTQNWFVSFGAQTKTTAIVASPSRGFSGWQTANMQFTATNSSQLLSFLAHGTPIGQPPFVFLDNVQLSEAVPEAATWLMMVTGFGAIGLAVRRRRRRIAPA